MSKLIRHPGVGISSGGLHFLAVNIGPKLGPKVLSGKVRSRGPGLLAFMAHAPGLPKFTADKDRKEINSSSPIPVDRQMAALATSINPMRNYPCQNRKNASFRRLSASPALY